jgi:Glucosamine 6-phosphate synthetase, contains amidotransferase and phosphosugar isomerase domains
MTDDLPEMRSRHPYVMYDMLKSTPSGIKKTLEIMEKAEIEFNGDRLYMTGNGTAFHSAVMGSAFLSGTDRQWYPVQAFELEKYHKPAGTVAAFSHTGKTRSTIDAVKAARKNAHVIGVTHYRGSPLFMESDVPIVIGDSPDLSLCNTKAFFDNAFASMEIASRFSGIDVNPTEVLDAVVKNLNLTERQAAEAASSLKSCRDIFVLGAGPNYYAAREAAQKMKESTHLHAEGIELEEFNHGCTAVLDEHSLVVIINSPEVSERASQIMRACRHTSTKTLVIDGDGDFSIHTERTGDINMDTIPEMVPLYYLAYFLAVEKGINPDMLRFEDRRYLDFDNVVFPPGGP